MARRTGNNYSGPRWLHSHRTENGQLRREEGVTIMGSSVDAHIRRQHHAGVHTDCDRQTCAHWRQVAAEDDA